MTAPTLSEQRAALGLKTPTLEQKRLIWSKVQSPTAGIAKGYTPLRSAAQAHAADSRGVAVSGGWRAGKSLMAGMEAAGWLPFADLIWIIAPDYDLARQEFIYTAEAAMSSGLARSKDVHLPLNKYMPCVLKTITGCVVETRTLADIRKLAARPPDVIIVCEPGLIDNLGAVMELLWGRVSEKRGRILLAGTSDEASEEWYELWSAWKQEGNIMGGTSFSIPTWENKHRFPLGRKEDEFLRYEEVYGRESLLAHYGGIPASPRDLVLRDYWRRDLHVTDEGTAFNPAYPAEITVDPNYSLGHRYAVMLVQWDRASGRIWLADEVALEGNTHDEVIAECQRRDWWPYVLGGTIDPYAGESHVYGSEMPTTYWNNTGVSLRADHRPKVNTTVQALKEAMSLKPETQRPRMLVHPLCERFIWEAARWRQNKYGKPDENGCDALKATGYWLVDHFAEERLQGFHKEGDNIVSVRDWSVV